jgi:hypothetical protein
MAPLARRDVALLRGWVQRALFGYWMHSGFMNWDTGLGFKRWMRVKTWAYAQQGLITIASARGFQNDRRYGRWAKTLFDRGLRFYERQAPLRAGLFGVDMSRRDRADARLTAARMGANAARALAAGLGHMPGASPPPFYAFDPDVGRLTVSTPAYGTAVVPVNRGAFPYGGIELARLYDAQGDPIGGIGAKPPAAFGVVVRDRRGHRVLSTQTGLRRDPAGAPLRVRRLPGGRMVRATGLPEHPPAGPFRVLEARGRRQRGGLVATTVHRFTRRSIVESWNVHRRSGRRRYTLTVQFPAWGSNADIDAVLDDGTTVALASSGRPGGTALMARVRRLEVSAPAGGYTVEPIGPTAGWAHVIRTEPQRSAPFQGSTLEIVLRTDSRFRTAGLRARIVPRPGE